jgi:hypothetical protein
LIEQVVISPLVPFEEAKAVKTQIEKLSWDNSGPFIRRSHLLGRFVDEQEDSSRIQEMLRDFLPEKEEPHLPIPFNTL